MKKKVINRFLLIIVFITFGQQLLANEHCPECPGIAPMDGTDDEPAGSIDQAIVCFLFVGVITAYYLLQKHKPQKQG